MLKTETDKNNESVSTGIAQNADGTFTAMTATKSKDFKTLRGARKWLAVRLSSAQLERIGL